MIVADFYTSDGMTNPSAGASVGIVRRSGGERMMISAEGADEGAGCSRTSNMGNKSNRVASKGSETDAPILVEHECKYDKDVVTDADEEASVSAHEKTKLIRWNLPSDLPVPQRTARWPVVKRKIKMSFTIDELARSGIEDSIDEIINGIDEVVECIKKEGPEGRLIILSAARSAYEAAYSPIKRLAVKELGNLTTRMSEKIESLKEQIKNKSDSRKKAPRKNPLSRMLGGKNSCNVALAQDLVNDMVEVYRDLKGALKPFYKSLLSPGSASGSVDRDGIGFGIAAAPSPAAAAKQTNPIAFQAAACACNCVKETVASVIAAKACIVTASGDPVFIACAVCGSFAVCASSVGNDALTRTANAMASEGKSFNELSDDLKQSAKEGIGQCLNQLTPAMCMDDDVEESDSKCIVWESSKGTDSKTHFKSDF